MRINFNQSEKTESKSGLGPVFIAQFDSECGECGDQIIEGDSARYNADHVVVHTDCAEE